MLFHVAVMSPTWVVPQASSSSIPFFMLFKIWASERFRTSLRSLTTQESKEIGSAGQMGAKSVNSKCVWALVNGLKVTASYQESRVAPRWEGLATERSVRVSSKEAVDREAGVG